MRRILTDVGPATRPTTNQKQGMPFVRLTLADTMACWLAAETPFMRAFIAIAISSIMLSGCASGSKDGKQAQSSATDAPGHVTLPSPDELRERLTGTNNGLEIRRWTVLDGGNTALNVIAQHAEGAAADQAATERLRQNGLRFVRVPAADVDVIVGELGGATMDRNEWHGQVLDWRSLREQQIDGRGMAVAIDGRVRRFDRGEFRLLVRSWTVMMEEGPNLHVEILPQHRLPQVNNMRRLLGEKPEDAGEAFASIALDLQLQSGFAYVLVSESPTIDWPQLDTLAPAVARGMATTSDVIEPSAPAAAPPTTATRPRIGPDDSVGPEAGAPRTLGEVLLPVNNNPPAREILVFVPKIPEELFPPVYESDLHTRAGQGSTPARRESEGGNGQ